MDIEQTTQALVGAFQNRITTRRSLLVLSVIISVMAYRYIITPYPERDLFGQVGRWLLYNGYDFYSGQDGGFYFAVGKALDEGTKGELGIKITNRPTAGGVENAIKVASSTSAFGIVQEDSILEGDFIRDELRFITPLYLEQVHVLYNKKRYKDITGDENFATVRVSPNAKLIRKFFTEAVISSGSPRSGSSIVASQMLNILETSPKQDLQIGSKDALVKLVRDSKVSRQGGTITNDPLLDAIIWITGGPNDLIVDALNGDGQQKDAEIAIMGVDPTVAQLINERYKSKLRPATFKDIYDNSEGVPTVGVYSFLISSNDVPSFAVMDLIETLEQEKPGLRSAMKYPQRTFQLDQFDFKKYYRRDYRGFLVNLIKNFFIFTVSTVLAAAGVMVFLVWIVSGSRQANYFRKLLHLYREYTPNNAELEERESLFSKPKVNDNQMPIVSKLTQGSNKLLLWGRAVRADYDKGIITAGHYNQLVKDFDRLREIFQKSLARRLCEVLYSGDVRNLVEVKDIRHFYTAGYIQRADYECLMRVFPKPEARPEE